MRRSSTPSVRFTETTLIAPKFDPIGPFYDSIILNPCNFLLVPKRVFDCQATQGVERTQRF